MKLLTIDQAKRLTALEETISRTGDAFVECGEALKEIHADKLYLKTCDSFEEYCEVRWGWKRHYAYRLMDAAKVKSSLGVLPIGNKITNEAQTRVLKHVPPEKREKVIKEAAKAGGVTAKSLCKAAEKIVGRSGTDEVVRDKTGYPVPPPAMEFWLRRDEVKELVDCISKARGALRKVDADADKMFAETNVNRCIGWLNQAYTELSTSIPFSVCTSCQGQKPSRCTLCRGRGVISKFLYDTAVPEELKAVRDKSCKK